MRSQAYRIRIRPWRLPSSCTTCQAWRTGCPARHCLTPWRYEEGVQITRARFWCVEALIRCTSWRQTTIAVICSVTGEAGTTENSLLNFVVSDGATLIATRFSSKEGESPASLYYAEGWSFERVVEQSAEESAGWVVCPSCFRLCRISTLSSGLLPRRRPEKSGKTAWLVTLPVSRCSRFFASQKEYRLKHGTTGSKLVMVASEPITNSCTDWVKVPPNTALVVTKEKGDFVNVLRSPLSTNGRHSLQVHHRTQGPCLRSVRLWRRLEGPSS